MKFSDNLKNIRKSLKLSQHDLANKLNVAQSTVGMWESGKRTPKLDDISRVSRVLNVTVARLLGNNREQKKVEISKNEIYIDGEKVGNATDNEITGAGYTGFLVAFANTSGFTVRVDELRYWNIP